MKNRKDSYFVRNNSDKQAKKLFSLSTSFSCALKGFVYTIKTQRNLKIHAVVALLAIALGFVLSLSLSSWLAVIICIGLVFTAECLNTALESLVDLVSPNYSELAKRAKDCAAAAVLVSAFISLIVAACVYGNALLAILRPYSG